MLRARVNYAGGVTGPAVSTLHFLDTDDQTAADDVSTSLQTFFTSVDSMISAAVLISMDQEVDIVDPATGLQTGSFQVTGWSRPGAAAGDSLPPATNGLLRLRTNSFVGGKEIRGRVFLPLPSESLSTNGAPTSAYTSAVNTAAAALIADTSQSWCVYSKKNFQAFGVTGATVWSKWAVLRSRRD